MRTLLTSFVWLCLLSLLSACHSVNEPSVRENILFDFDWEFHKGDVLGAENSYFDVTSWRKVDLPHDFSIEDIEGSKSPFDSTAVAGLNVGFTKGGTAWYRKSNENY